MKRHDRDDDHDFKVVNAVSIAAIFLIITLVEGSLLPFILIAVIELAIFINLGLPHVLGQSLPSSPPSVSVPSSWALRWTTPSLMTTRYKAGGSMARTRRRPS